MHFFYAFCFEIYIFSKDLNNPNDEKIGVLDAETDTSAGYSEVYKYEVLTRYCLIFLPLTFTENYFVIVLL